MTRRAFLFLALGLVVFWLATSLLMTSASSSGLRVLVGADEVSSLLAQTDAPGGEPVEAQAESGDGTKPLRILAVLLGVLALLLGALTRFYWKATIPEARRGYLPEAPQAEYGDGHGPTT